MFRKSALAMAMLGAFTTGNVVALGLGEIELKSSLNQPLNAEVELLSATQAELQELKVAIASNEAFAKAGIERPLFLTKLRFEIKTASDGKPVVSITSRETVQEPFLDFLLEISWSKGRLLREYTVLVDPPVTMPAPAPALQSPVAQPAKPASATALQPDRRVAHSAQMPPVSVGPGEYGPTKRNDTLWKVASQVRPDAGVSMEQTMLGLLRANPQAFEGNNINNLKAGYILRVPSREEMLSISRGEARREARAQYAAWRETRGLAQPVPDQVQSTSAPVTESRLQLVSPDSAEAAVANAGAEGDVELKQLQSELLMANEALEEQRRQGEEMSSRMSVLEEQIVNMQRLIQLKDEELARLQALAGADAIEPSVAELDGEAELAGADARVTGTAEVSAEDGVLSADAIVAADELAAESAPDETMGDLVSELMPDDAMGDLIPPLMPDEAMGDLTPPLMADEATADLTPPLMPDEATGDLDTELLLDEDIADTLVADAETNQLPAGAATENAVQADLVAEEPKVESAVTTAAVPEATGIPAIVEKLTAHPSWLGAGGVVVALLAFLGLRRRRGVDTEFQESILQAAQESSTAVADDALVTAHAESTRPVTSESSLLSEFAVSDMGTIRNDGEADPLAEADVYLAYGRYQQAEDLIKGALENDPERDDLNLKLLEIYLAGRNKSAFDQHAEDVFARLQNSENPLWEKVIEMGRELSPENPMYTAGAATRAVATDDDAEIDGLSDRMEFNIDSEASEAQAFDSGNGNVEKGEGGDEGLDFDLDLSFDPDAVAKAGQPEAQEESRQPSEQDSAPQLNVAMDSVEPDVVEQDDALDFDLESYELDNEALAETELEGDGELADLDEVSTKLDLARAYIDMGDPDGAKNILDEVMDEGNDEQKDEARGIMAQMA